MTDRLSGERRMLVSHCARQALDGTLRDDVGQRKVLEAPDRRLTQLDHPASRPLRSRPESNGLSIWGHVGRGKTRVMDLFFAHTGLVEKRRTHFDAFLRDLHAASHVTRNEDHADPLGVAVRRIAGGIRLLALDELEVRDAAVSTLLCRVFAQLFAAGVTLAATSTCRRPSFIAPA